MAAVRPNPSQGRRCHSLEEIKVGSFFWLSLPEPDLTPVDGLMPDSTSVKVPLLPCQVCTESHAIDKGGFEHPTIVLKLRKDAAGVSFAYVAQVSSFNQMSLKKYIKKRDKATKYQITIPVLSPENRCLADSLPFPSLMLAGGKSLQKQSYVKYKCAFETPISLLKPTFRMSGRRLDEKSYSTLVQLLGIEPDPYDKAVQPRTPPPTYSALRNQRTHLNNCSSSPSIYIHQLAHDAQNQDRRAATAMCHGVGQSHSFQTPRATTEQQPLLDQTPYSTWFQTDPVTCLHSIMQVPDIVQLASMVKESAAGWMTIMAETCQKIPGVKEARSWTRLFGQSYNS